LLADFAQSSLAYNNAATVFLSQERSAIQVKVLHPTAAIHQHASYVKERYAIPLRTPAVPHPATLPHRDKYVDQQLPKLAI
jgi:hypothetical protein